MEEGDGCEESLFSLEFLVESANVEPRLVPAPVPASGPFRLAVALRLLDFPTLLVRAPHCGPGPVVPFGRGKSCLFKLRPDALKSLLRRSPLCALLLALPPTPGPARLLGSSSVSLASAAEELLLGTGPGGRRGRFPLRDLMGELVGELGLSYRLNNLGAALLGHLGQGAAPGEPQVEEQPQQPLKKQQHLMGSPPPPPPSPRNILNSQGESGLNLELIPEGDEDQDPAPDGGSLRSLSSSSSSSTESQPHNLECGDQGREPETEANIFCPPPLYYSHTPESPSPPPKVPKPAIVAAPQKPSKKKEAPVSPAVPVQKEPATEAQETIPSLQMLSNPEMIKQTLNQLPLLNALLVELSLLNNQALEPGPCTVHPQLAWLYRNAEDYPKTPSPSSKSLCPNREDKKSSHHRKERERSPSPKFKKNRPDHIRCLSPSVQITYTGKGYPKSACFERPSSPDKYNTKENTPPRRKLTYGLTNTLRLRLQRANPGTLIPHEKRDHHRKKHIEVLVEKKGKGSSGKVKTPRSSPERRQKSSRHANEKVISDQNAQFNDNIETLIQNSIDQDCYTVVKRVTSDLQSNVVATGTKNSENTKEKGPPEVTDPALLEKCLKIHLPKVSLQVTDTENKTNVGPEKCVQNDNCNSTTLHQPSENSQEHKNPDEIVASCENTAYSDDFTGTGSSRTSLDAAENSPAPLEENPKANQSVLDSDAKMIERSPPSDIVSPPLPIPSAISPVQSLKKTSDLKSNEKNIIIGLNELDGGDSTCERTVEEELAAQYEKKEERKDVEGKQVSFDMDDNLTEDLVSVEKSQSLRTSQVSSYLPSNVSDLDLHGLEESKASDKEKEDSIEVPDVINQCKHVSELVVNNLPGYTM